MSKNANKKRRYRREGIKPMSQAAINRFKTGYDDPVLVKAALEMGESKGAQKCNRDKMNYGIRYAAPNRHGESEIKTGKASKNTGVFLGPDSQVDDAYGREMNRIMAQRGENGRIERAFRN